MSGTQSTPGRKTVFTLSGDSYELQRPSFSKHIDADYISRVLPKIANAYPGIDEIANKDVLHLPGAWMLNPLKGEIIKASEADFPQFAPAEVQVASNFTAVQLDKRNTDIPGLSETGYTTPPYQWIRTPGAGATWDNGLTADATAFPSPALSGNNIPMDRVFTTIKTFPANTTFLLTFGLTHRWGGRDEFLRFLFGGPTSTSPTPNVDSSTLHAGTFCLSLRGDGTATLWERSNTVWVRRKIFSWQQANKVVGRLHVIGITPYVNNKIAFGTITSDDDSLIPLFFNPTKSKNLVLYEEDKGSSGHLHTAAMTGEGPVRIDLARNIVDPFGPIVCAFPSTGKVFSDPFTIHKHTPGGTKIKINSTFWRVVADPTVNVVHEVFDASTGLACSLVDGEYVSNEGQYEYYIRFTLNSDAAKKYTPYLLHYDIHVDAARQFSQLTPLVVEGVQSLSIVGPDITPEHESASIKVSDPTAKVNAVLLKKSRVYSTIDVYKNNALYTRLFEGETAPVMATKRGRRRSGPTLYPHESWCDIDIELFGKWSRIVDQLAIEVMSFYSDGPMWHSDAVPDPTTNKYPPWKVVDILRYYLDKAGVPPDEIDIPATPENNIRLFTSPGLKSDDYLVTPTTPYGYVLIRLTRDFMGQAVIRDPNAGARGMWRLIPNIIGPGDKVVAGTPTLAKFYTRYNLQGGPKNVIHEKAYDGLAGGVASSPIIDESFRVRVYPPEGNHVIVTAGGQLSASGKGGIRVVAEMHNFKSYNPKFPTITADPSHSDFLGRWVPIFVIDPFLGPSQQAVNFVCRRIFDASCHAQTWAWFVSNLITVTNPNDPHQRRPRPLRFNDLVQVFGSPFVIKNCNPNYIHDGYQMALYEGRFVDVQKVTELNLV